MTNNLPLDANDANRAYGRWMIVAIWLLILGFGTWFAQRWLNQRAEAQFPAIVGESDSHRAIELTADRRGHYLVAGAINGHAVDFLVDTGASDISLPEAVASRLGLDRGLSFPVSTANGSIRVFDTDLNEVRLGNLGLHDVRANINPGMDGDVALLGMSFLSHFDLFQQSGKLTIQQPAGTFTNLRYLNQN